MADGQLSKSFVTPPQTHRVFVYGTLRRGHRNHFLLETSTFIGEAATLRPYWMITTGVFPVVLDAVPADFGFPPLAIAGEIYHVDDATLEQLDRLEDKGRAYDRRVTDVYEGGHKVQAYIYIGVADYWHHRRLPAWTIQNTRRELEWAAS
jgi:gamma-glutamylcyclotransferase (GGCT)/AIG2-like uncharacterized protein YtfP